MLAHFIVNRIEECRIWLWLVVELSKHLIYMLILNWLKNIKLVKEQFEFPDHSILIAAYEFVSVMILR